MTPICNDDTATVAAPSTRPSKRSRGYARRRAAFATALAVVLAGAACFAERRGGFSRDGLWKALEESPQRAPLPTLDELRALRVPEPAARPSDVDGKRPVNDVERALLAAAKGDIPAVEKVWAKKSGADVAELHAQRCLVESVLRRYENVVSACGAFLDEAAFDERAPAAARILERAQTGFSPAGALIAQRGAAWVAACAKGSHGANGAGARCADLAFVVGAERREAARVAKDVAALDAARRAAGLLRRAHLEGPYDGDMRVMLARDLNGEALTPRAPFFTRADEDEADGVFSPSLRGPDGLYRLRFATVKKSAGPARVFVTGTHAVRVRIDGRVVAERPVDKPAPQITIADVALKAGPHVVDVLAWSTGRGDDLQVALLDPQGAPALDEVDAMPSRGAGVTVTVAAAAVPAPLAVDPAAAAGGSADVAGLMALLWQQVLARYPAFGVDPDDNRAIAGALIGRYGWSPLALAVAAEIVGDDKSVPERVSSSAAAQLWSIVLQSWPDHPVARIAEARNLREERPDEALHAFRALAKAQPKYAFGQRELIDIALDTGLVDEARAAAAALVGNDPSPENLAAAADAYKAAGDHVQAAAMEEKRARADDDLASTRVAKRLLDAGKTEEGLAALQKAATAERGSHAIEEYASLLALSSPDAALRFVDGAAAAFENDPGLAVKKAELLASTKGEAAARAYLASVLPRMRDSESAARYAEELGIAPPWASRLALGDEIVRERRAMTSAPFPGYPAVALLDDIERFVNEDDSSLNIRHLIIELRTKEVLDRFGELSVGDARVVRVRVIKPDGSVVERERHHGVDDLSLPQLSPGDIVELLTVDKDGASRIGGSFETRGLDGTSTPALSRRYILNVPDGWDDKRGLTLVAQNGLPAPAPQSVVDGEGRKRKVFTFAAENVAGATNEPFAPDRSETSRTGGFAWGIDNATWARLRGVTVEQAALGNGWLTAAAQKIAGNGSDEQKLRNIFDFVVRRIEPDSAPDDASAVLATGQGERTPLFIALLRAVGLDADPVALQLVTQPDPSTFDSSSWSVLAVRVRSASSSKKAHDHYAIVDNNAVLDQLPEVARGARVLDLSLAPPTGANAEKLVSALPDDVIDDTGVLVQVDLALDAAAGAPRDRALTGLVVVTIPPSKADGARRGVRRATPEQLKEIVERSFSDSLPGIAVSEVKTPNLDLAGAALRLGARVTVPLPEGERADEARFDHLFAHGASGGLQLSAALGSYLAVADRKLPLLVVAEREVLEVQLALPKTAAFVEAPEPLERTAGPFSLSQKVQIEDGRLYWRREIRKQNARISVEDWPAVRVGLAGLAARTDARLSFVAGKAPAVAGGGTKSDSGAKRAAADQNR